MAGNHAIVFACQRLIDQAFQFDISQMHVDTTLIVVPIIPKCYQLLIIHVIVENYVSNIF